MNAISRLRSREEWVIARDKMKKEYSTLPDHYWMYYFPTEPSFGFASKPPGLVNSTNGLERFWRTIKETRKRSREMKEKDIFEVMNIIDVVEETFFAERKFETTPKVDPSWYQNIVAFSDYQQAGPDILCNVMYNGDTGTVLSGKDIISIDGCNRYVCYMPTDLLFSIVKKDVLKEMNFNLNERFSLTGSLLMAGKLKSANPVITESLSFRVKLMLNIGQKLLTNSVRHCQNDDLKEFLTKFAMREKRECNNVKVERHNGEEVQKNMEKNAVFGPLGYFYKVEVDRINKKVKCNCEFYNTWGNCIHVVLFEILEFNCLPNLSMRKADGVQWEKIRDRLKKNVLCKSVFDEGKKEEKDYACQYIAFFPPIDPQYSSNV